MNRFRKFCILLLIICFTAAAYLLVLSDGELQKTFHSQEELPSADKLFPEEPEVLRKALLLEKLLEMPFPDNEEGLLSLSSREDAVGYKASLNLARYYAHNGEEAAELFEHALSLYETDDVKKELASHLENKGLEEEAVRNYMQTLPDKEAQEALLDLESTPEEIGHYLYDNFYYQALVNFTEPYLGNSTAEIKYLHSAGLANTGNYKEALPLLEELLKEDFNNDNLQLYYARCLEESGDDEKALEIYEEIAPKGNYRRGIILYSRGNKSEAAQALSSATEQEARWWGARLLEELGQTSKALPIYMELAAEEGDLKDDAAYRAYMLLSANEDPRAEEFLDILSGEPAWKYRLDKNPAFEEKPPLSSIQPTFIKRAEAYEKSGRNELSELELAIGEKLASPEELLALGNWHLEDNDYFRAVRVGIELLEQHPCPETYKLAFPRPYMDKIENAAEDYEIDPYLLLAVMREESHFRPEAVSNANARGLMQIIPSTGQDIAERKGIDVEMDDLFDEELNIRMGSFYLRSMLNIFEEDLDKSLAAYNAGAGNVRQWQDSPIAQDPGGFPTAIPYWETREYITKVMNSYLTYKWIYG